LNALLFSDPGRFRLIVFIVSSTPFAAIGPPLSEPEGRKLLYDGMNTVPKQLLQEAFLPEHQVSVLIYEFQKDKDRDPKLVAPSALPARTHLEKAMVWAGLNGIRDR
jgi:hypothetical protein